MKASDVCGTLAIIVTCYFCFENGIMNGFAFDDHLAIVGNADSNPNTPLENIWKDDIWGKSLTAHDSHRSFRPALIFTFRQIWYFLGHEAKYFRVVSIICHTIVSILVYFLSKKISGNNVLALGGSLLFASHPVHVESVTAVVNIAESLSALFYIGSFQLFLHLYERPSSLVVSFLGKILWLIFIFIGILFKESAISACGMVVAVILIDSFASYASSLRYNGMLSFIKHILSHWWRNKLWLIMPFVVFSMYVMLRHYVITGVVPFESFPIPWLQFTISLPNLSLSGSYLDNSRLIRKAENPFAKLVGVEKAMSLMYLHFRYFWVQLWPIELSPEYAFDCIPKVSSVFDPHFQHAMSFYFSILCLILLESIALLGKQQSDVNKRTSMTTLAWYVISFAPASGVFLVLGTLLAERLLYVPSIAFCLLLSCFIYSFFLRWVNIIFKSETICKGLYLFVVVIITSLYALRSREYNLFWKDDATLFVHSLSVCPRSAKLNLQVAKLHINSGDFARGKYFVDTAKRIDPEFCDIGYQEALIAYLHDHDIDETMEIAAQNLDCIFTSHQSWELLSKLMEQQIALFPNDYSIVEKHASILMGTPLKSLACKKYHLASNLAYQQGKHVDAIKLSRKSLDLRNNLMEDYRNEESQDPNVVAGVMDLFCSIHSFGGRLRYEFSKIQTSKKSNSKLEKMLKKEFDDIFTILMAALIPECVILREDYQIISNPALTSLTILAEKLNSQFNTREVKSVEEFAMFSDQAAIVLVKMDLSSILSAGKDKKSDISLSIARSELNEKAIEMVRTSMYLWMIAGKLYFKEGNYVLSADRFKRALQYHVTVPGLPSSSSILISSAYSVRFSEWWRTMIALYGDQISVGDWKDPSYVMYWYAHALAGKNTFLLNKIDMEEVYGALAFIQSRLKNSTLVKNNISPELVSIARSSNKQIKKLNLFCSNHSEICSDINII